MRWDLLPSLMSRAEWQHRAGYYNDERATYRRTIRIIETSSGKEDPRLVEPLVKLGETFYYYNPVAANGTSGSTGATGETYFKRAIRIAEEIEDFPWLEMATTKLALADYYGTSNRSGRARRFYKEVWDDLSIDEDRIVARRDLLERPVLLRYEPLPLSTGKVRSASSGGHAAEEPSVLITRFRHAAVSRRSGQRPALQNSQICNAWCTGRSVGDSSGPRWLMAYPVEAANQVFVHEFSVSTGRTGRA